MQSRCTAFTHADAVPSLPHGAQAHSTAAGPYQCTRQGNFMAECLNKHRFTAPPPQARYGRPADVKGRSAILIVLALAGAHCSQHPCSCRQALNAGEHACPIQSNICWQLRTWSQIHQAAVQCDGVPLTPLSSCPRRRSAFRILLHDAVGSNAPGPAPWRCVAARLERATAALIAGSYEAAFVRSASSDRLRGSSPGDPSRLTPTASVHQQI